MSQYRRQHFALGQTIRAGLAFLFQRGQEAGSMTRT
jgi:hypothetical protein